MRPITLTFLLVLPPAAVAGPPLVVEARYPGASAGAVAEAEAVPLEKTLAGVAGVRRVRSLSLDGRCLVRFEFGRSADSHKARAEAARRLRGAARALPEVCAYLGVRLLPEADDSFLVVALRTGGATGVDRLRALARDAVRPRLLRLSGVADVRVVGQEDAPPGATLDPERLAALDLTLADVLSALRRASRKPPKKAERPEDVVIAERDGKKVRLRDLDRRKSKSEWSGDAGVALREGRAEERSPRVVVSPAVLLVVQTRPGARDVPAALDATLAGLRGKFPDDVRAEKHLLRPGDLTASLRVIGGGSRLDRQAHLARPAAEAALRVPQARAALWLTPAGGEGALLLLFPATAGRGESLRAALRSELGKLEHVAVHLGGLRSPLDGWPGEGMQVVARVCGSDPAALRKAADRLSERLGKVRGVVDLDPGPAARVQLVVDLDRAKCKRRLLSMTEVVQLLQTYSGLVELGGVGPEARADTLTLRLEPGGEAKRAVEDLKKLLMVHASGRRVPLGAVAEVRAITAPPFIYREGGRPCLVVSCNVHGRDVAAVREEVRKAAKGLSGKGVRVEVE